MLLATAGAALAALGSVGGCFVAERSGSGQHARGAVPSPAPVSVLGSVPPLAAPAAGRPGPVGTPRREVNPEAAVGALSEDDPGTWPGSQGEADSAAANLGETELGSGPIAPGDQDGVGRASVDPERALIALAKHTAIHAAPEHRSRKLGYLRVGAVVARSAEPSGHSGCAGGWYAVEPEGHVCVGGSASLRAEDAVASASQRRPARAEALPYVYGRPRYPTPPLYLKVPSRGEQERAEPELVAHPPPAEPEPWRFVELGAVPKLAAGGTASRSLREQRYSEGMLTVGRARPQSGFAFLEFFAAEGRWWGLDVDLEVLPLDRLDPVRPSAFHGLELENGVDLPVVFVHARNAYLYHGDPHAARLTKGRRLGFREVFPLSGRRVVVGGSRYLETRTGDWLLDERLIRVDRFRERPGWVRPGRTWIDVSILRQSLVAYEGDTPVYVTLVSTGIDGLGDPEKTHSTVRGQFLIHTKHVTITMSGDEIGDEFDLRDVPFVQYFNEGYAIHAAYWHDGFGLPRSHGCINLSPLDARWLFDWTDPEVPADWHGAMSLDGGTLVTVHP